MKNRPKACVVLFTLFLGCLLSAFSYANDPFVFDKSTNTLKHVNSGFVFPSRVGDFLGGDDVRIYDPSGKDVSVPYNLVRGNDYVAATVYIYAIPAAPGLSAADILNYHFENLKTEILGAYRGGSLVSEDKVSIRGLAGRKAGFKIELMGETTESELYLFAHQGWFIKYRISYPAKSANFARPEILKFVKSLDLISPKHN